MYKKIIAIFVGSILLSGVAHAVPWCQKGSRVQIADVNWSEPSILFNFSGTVPSGVGNPDYYMAHEASLNYAAGFSGGGGAVGGYSVTGSGSVIVVPYAPVSFVQGMGTYSTSQGVRFKIIKCYTIVPLTQHLDVFKADYNDGKAVMFEPLEGLEVIRRVWDTNEDEPGH